MQDIINIPEIFGSDVFNESTMKQRLPSDTYLSWKQCIETSTPLELSVANEIADTPIKADRVQSVVICEIEFLAHFYNFFFSSWGLLAVIALIILVFIDELIILVKTIAGVKPKSQQADIDDIIGRIQAQSSNDDQENS